MTISIGDISFSQSQGYVNSSQNNPGFGSKEQQAGSNHSTDPVRLSLSPEAEKLIKQTGQGERPGMSKEKNSQPGSEQPGQKKDVQLKQGTAPGQKKLSEAEQKMVDELQQRDREVRAHEAAHAAAAGSYAVGGPNFDYENGPDGRSYAIGGNVKLDMSPESTPEATIAKMETIRRAALAPADPSGQDRAVAAAATKAEMEARQAENQEFTEKMKLSGHNGKFHISQGKISVRSGTYGMSDALHPRGQLLNGVG